MSEKWYVVHVTTSFEDTVKRYIFEQMKLDNCPGLISDVLVPTETLEEQLKGGKKKDLRGVTGLYKHIDMEKLMKGKEPITVYSGSMKRPSNTWKSFK